MFEKLEIPQNLIPSDPRFGAGPSLVPVEHMQSLAATGTHLLGNSHRKPAVKKVVQEVQEGLVQYFQLPSDYLVALGNGGATLLFDMIGLGLVEKQSSHFCCGEFSSKWKKSHALIPWINVDEVSVEYGQGITPTDRPNSDMICATLNETSTGVIIDQVPSLSDDKLFCLDATSGGGQVPFDIKKSDITFFSPQKVFASEGGTWIAMMSQKAMERAYKLAESDRYIPEIMNWKTALDNSKKHQTYNTPSISTLFFLNEQLKRMNEKGYQKIIEETQANAQFIYQWAEEKPYLSCYVQEEKYRSNAVATIDLDDKIPATELTQFLRDQKAVYDIDGYRKLGRNQIRIALFTNIAREDIEKLTELISFCCESVL